MDERVVPIRTSASARDFWSRERESKELSPNFCILPPNKDTPFGRQEALIKPVARPPFSVLPNDAGQNRRAEKKTLCSESHTLAENARLRRANARLEVQIQRLLQINAALSSEMARAYKAAREP